MRRPTESARVPEVPQYTSLWSDGRCSMTRMAGGPLPVREHSRHGSATEPSVGAHRTSRMATDKRFDNVEKITANASEAAEIVVGIVGKWTFGERVEPRSQGEGQWAAVRNAGKLVANPVRFDETPVSVTRVPHFAEHTDEALRELGLSNEEFSQPKIDGAATRRPADPLPTNPLPIARIW